METFSLQRPFFKGFPLEEVDGAKLDIHDQAYPVIITLRVQKR